MGQVMRALHGHGRLAHAVARCRCAAPSTHRTNHRTTHRTHRDPLATLAHGPEHRSFRAHRHIRRTARHCLHRRRQHGQRLGRRLDPRGPASHSGAGAGPVGRPARQPASALWRAHPGGGWACAGRSRFGGVGGQTAALCRGRTALRGPPGPGAAPERDGRHPQRCHRPRHGQANGHCPHRAQHAQHARAHWPRHRRVVCHTGRHCR